MSSFILNCVNLRKVYHEYCHAIEVLKNVNLTAEQGESIAIVGSSGSGKSTLLHLLGGLDRPTSGQITITGSDWQTLTEKERCVLRNQQLGFIYQFHHLLPEFSALENVAMPLLLANLSMQQAHEKAQAMLAKVGLSQRESHKPAQLSGGERQRVAIARALVHEPKCVLADEPTGNLDQETAAQIFDLMLDLNQQFKTTLIIVTHDRQLAKLTQRVMILQEGKLKD